MCFGRDFQDLDSFLTIMCCCHMIIVLSWCASWCCFGLRASSEDVSPFRDSLRTHWAGRQLMMMPPDTCICLCECPSVRMCLRYQYFHVCVCVCPCMHGLVCFWAFTRSTLNGHICISLDEAAVSFFGVTEDDLELLSFRRMCQIQAMDLNVCVCVCVCVHNVEKRC